MRFKENFSRINLFLNDESCNRIFAREVLEGYFWSTFTVLTKDKIARWRFYVWQTFMKLFRLQPLLNNRWLKVIKFNFTACKHFAFNSAMKCLLLLWHARCIRERAYENSSHRGKLHKHARKVLRGKKWQHFGKIASLAFD